MTEQPSKMRIRRMSELPTPPVPTWLARRFIPRNEITALVGEEGIGKSLLWVLLVAYITTGRAFAALGLPARPPADVVLIITEDAAGEVMARLTLAGADLTRVHLFSESDDGSGTPTFPADMPALYAWAAELKLRPALIVVDAWLDTVPEGLRVQAPQEGRVALAPWKEAATRLQTSVLLVTHTNRMDTASTRDLVGATVAIRQKARMILFAARHPDDGQDGQQHLWVGPDKSNTSGPTNAVKFAVTVHQVRPQTEDDPGTVAILDRAADTGSTIRNLLHDWRTERQQADREPSSIDKAETFVREYMTGRGSVPSSEVKEAAKAAGFGQRAVSVAMGRVGESKPAAPGQPWMFTVGQSVQPPAISDKSANTATSANTDQREQSVQSRQSVQSLQEWGEPAKTGATCRACGEALSPVLAAEGLHAGCEADS